MKRELNCVRCADTWRAIAADPDPEAVAAGESLTVVRGAARHTYRCDGCNLPILHGAECYAVGLTTGDQKAPPNWEAEFIEVAQ